MKRKVSTVFLVCFLVGFSLRAADEPAKAVQQVEKVEEGVPQKVNLSSRLDLGLSRGVSANEGFKIPGLRLSASGEITSYLNYRISIGQTKEYSSVLLPQLLPVEAFITLEPKVPEDFARFKWKIGLMSPTLNPWFSPDLGDLKLPDYLETHKLILLSRDLGSEIIMYPWSERMEVAFGVFNGNGILGTNSNGSISITGMAKLNLITGEQKLFVGGSGLFLKQGSQGGTNYKSQNIANGFVSWENRYWSLGAEGSIGYYEDDIRKLNPAGGAAFVDLKFAEHLSLLGRWEFLEDAPPTGLTVRRVQTGPVWAQGDFLWVFFYYQWFDEGNGTGDSSAELRIRVNI